MGIATMGRSNITSINNDIKMTSQKLAKSFERLSSGKRLVSSADEPSTIFISERLNSQVASLDQAIQNTEVDVSMLQVADSSLSDLSSILIRMRQLAVQGANESILTQEEKQLIQREYMALLDAFDDIVKSTKFSGKSLLDGSSATSGNVASSEVEFVKGSSKNKTTGPEGLDLVITQGATRSHWVAGDYIDEDIVADEDVTFKIIENGKVASYKSNPTDTPSSVASALQISAEKAGLDVTVTLEDEKLLIYHNKFGSEHTFQVESSYDGLLSDDEGIPNEAILGKDVEGILGDFKLRGRGQILEGDAGTEMEGLVLRYTALYEFQEGIYGLEDEGGERNAGKVFLENNSLIFQTGIEHGSKQSLSLQNLHTNNLARGVINTNEFKNLREIDMSTHNGASDSILLLDNAIGHVNEVRSEVGAVQKYGLEMKLDNLRVMKENISAAKSTITDTDYAEELSQMIKSRMMLENQYVIAAQANKKLMNLENLLD